MSAKNKTVTMIGRISGTRNGEDWPAPGEKITLPEDEAVQLVAAGMATLGKIETATAAGGVETATTGNAPLNQAKAAAEAKAAADAQAAAEAKAAADAAAADAKAADAQAKEAKTAAEKKAAAGK